MNGKRYCYFSYKPYKVSYLFICRNNFDKIQTNLQRNIIRTGEVGKWRIHKTRDNKYYFFKDSGKEEFKVKQLDIYKEPTSKKPGFIIFLYKFKIDFGKQIFSLTSCTSLTRQEEI